MTAIIKLADRFTETTVDDEVVVMHLASGDFFSLTDTARAIWERIDGAHTREAIIAALAEEYGEPVDRIAPEIDEFLARLRHAGLLAGE